ncbi:MAG: 50S ribosomal protein L24 [Planctomycetota bacterium]
MARHIRTGETVMVTAGDHKGQAGEVLRIDTKRDRVYVKGVNVKTKHLRRTQANPQGGTISVEAPIHISNVSPVVDGKPTRVRFERKSDGSKVRVAVRGGKELSNVSSPKAAHAGKGG